MNDDTKTLRALCDEQAKTIRRLEAERLEAERRWHAVCGTSSSQADTIEDLDRDLAAAKAQVERLTKALDDLAYLSRNCTTTRIILRNRIQAALADTAPMAKPGDPGHFGPHDGGVKPLTAPSGEGAQRWRCRRCGSEVDMERKRCLCTESPSPWEPVPSGEGLEERCPDCEGTGWAGDQSAGFVGKAPNLNDESAPCDRCQPPVANAPKPPSGWQDIVTAPKDGTRFLARESVGLPEGVHWSGHYWKTDDGSQFFPVGWKPLLPAPKEGES